MNRLVCSAGLVAALAASSDIPGRAQGRIPSAMDLLERYARGDAAAAAADLAEIPDDKLEPLGRTIQEAATAWLKVPDDELARHRRLAAAVLALDLVHAGYHTQWNVLDSFVEWGCGLIRQNPPGEFERSWHLASVALAGAARATKFLTDPQVVRGGDRAYNHLKHAAEQFPGEPRWKLARAMALEFSGMSEGVRDAGGVLDWSFASATAGPLTHTQQLRAIRRKNAYVIGAFEEILEVPGITAEAHLHLGHELFIARESDIALRHYEEAGRRTQDPYIRYLSHFLAGRLFHQRGAAAEATAHYERALEILPNTQSASTAVAARRFIEGRPDHAYTILESAFAARPRPPDPWRWFFRGDYRFWPELIARLHGSLR